MREEYDFTNARKNPYVNKDKQQVTITLDNDVILYFKETATESGIPYQTLINMYLSECANKNLKPTISWQ